MAEQRCIMAQITNTGLNVKFGLYFLSEKDQLSEEDLSHPETVG